MNKKSIYGRVLDLEKAGAVDIEISYRGGHYGLRRAEAIDTLGIPEQYAGYLPPKVGVYCNYLGGGLRGSIVAGGYDDAVPARYARSLDAFGVACKKRYLAIESEIGLNAEEDEDGEKNWEAIGSNTVRAAGVISAY